MTEGKEENQKTVSQKGTAVMNSILSERITGPAAWTGKDFESDTSWIHLLSEGDIAEIDAALAHCAELGAKFPKVSKKDFPLPGMLDRFHGFLQELEDGRGFLLLRGLPLERYTDAEINLIYYAIGMHMGTPVGQNPKGDLLGKVMNVGDLNDKNTRVYETNAYLPYHTDPSDVVGLLCLRKAKSGGLSSLVSVAAVYNEILENHREHLGIFYTQMFFAHLGEELPTPSQIFCYNEGKLSCRYLRQYVELGHEICKQPLSRVEVEALNIFDSIVHNPAFRIDMMLEPGDLQFANNYAVLHSRNSFEDFEDPEKRRKMLRLWLKMSNARIQGDEFPGRNGFAVPASVFA